MLIMELSQAGGQSGGAIPGAQVGKPGIVNPILGPTLQGKSGIGFFQSLLPALIGWGFVIGVVVFLFIIIIGAVGWMLSGGDKAGVEAARGKITGALTGVVLLFVLFAILTVIGDFFGIKILTLDIGPLKIQ